jgi:hypothetical protein
MMKNVANVFVSYRREDSAPYAGRVCDRLEGVLGRDHVFIDVEDIAPGMDFVQTIANTVGRCDVLVAIIGPRWVQTLQARNDEQDFVEYEIAVALDRGITIIPVLVGGATMPAQGDLPPRLQGFHRRQALVISDMDFDRGADELLRAVGRATSKPKTPHKVLWAVIAAGLIIAVGGAAALLMNSRERVSIDGNWIARMQRPRQPAYNIRLRFHAQGRTLTGAVSYPTGSATIEGGTINRRRLGFFTRHTPQFESAPATILFSGEIRGVEIDLTVTTPDGTEIKGVARRAD